MSTLIRAKQLMRHPLVVLDTETTGFHAWKGDEIVELAGERLEDGHVIDTFHAYLKPSGPMNPHAIAVHGLDDDFLDQHGRSPGDVFAEFSQFITGTVLVGHNIRRFDFPFLASHFSRHGLPRITNDMLDTLELARATLELRSYALGSIATHFDIDTTGAHRAAADVAMTRQVLLRLLD